MAQYNYYVGVGVKIVTSPKELRDLLSKYNVAVNNVKVNFDVDYMAAQFKAAIKKALGSISVTNLGIDNSTKPFNIKDIEPSAKLESSVKAYNELGKVIKVVNTYAIGTNKTLKVVTDGTGKLISTQQTLKTHNTEANIALKNVQERFTYFKQNGKLTAQQINYFTQELNRISKLTGKDKVEAIKVFNRQLSDTGKRALSIGEQFKEASKKFMVWSAATVTFASLVKAIRSIIQEIKKLDDAIVELNKVADLTNKELSGVIDKANELADKVYSTADQALLAVAQFKKAGYELNQSFDLAEVAIRMTNVADGITNTEEAASSLIAILKGFGLEASSANRVLDLLNHTSNNFAVDTDDLTNGMTRISAVMAQSGTSIEETIALLTAVTEVMRNAEVASQGLNAISQRIRKVTEDGEDNTKVIAKIQSVFDKYVKGVSVYDVNGELRSTYDILADLQPRWAGLSSEVKAYVTEAIAGNRQNKILVALMQNWETVDKVITESANAAGSAIEEEGKFADSVQGKLNQLKQAWNELAQATLDSNLLKFFIDAGKSVVKLATYLGGLHNVLFAISGLVVGIKLPVIVNYVMALTKGFRANHAASVSKTISTKAETQAVNENTQAMQLNNAAMNTNIASTNKLSKALKIASLAITGITIVWSAVTTIINKIKADMEEAITLASENATKQKERFDEFLKERDVYLEYSQTINKTAKEITALNAAEKNLAETYGFVSSQMDLANDSLDARKEKLKALFNVQRTEVQKTIDAYQKQINTLGKNTSAIRKSELWTGTRAMSLEEYLSKRERTLLKNVRAKGEPKFTVEEIRQFREGWTNTYNQLLKELQGNEAYQEITSLQNQITALQKVYQDEEVFNLSNLIAQFQALPTFALEQGTDIGDLADTQVNSIATIDAVIAKVKELLNLENQTPEVIQMFNSIIERYTTLKDTIEKTDFAYNTLDEKLSILKKIQSEREEELKTEEKLKAVEEARLALAKAQNKYVLTYTSQGWRYVKDESAMQSATEQLTKAIQDAGLDDLSQAINGVEQLQEILSTMTGDEKDAMLAYYREAGKLADWLEMDYASKLAVIDSIARSAGYKGSYTQDYLNEWGKTGTRFGNLTPYIPSSHTGGVIGGVRTNPNEQITKLLKGELVLTEGQQKALVNQMDKQGGGLSINIGNISTKEQDVDVTNFIEQIKQIGSMQRRTKRI